MSKRFTIIIVLSLSLILLSSCANKKEEMNKIVTDNSRSTEITTQASGVIIDGSETDKTNSATSVDGMKENEAEGNMEREKANTSEDFCKVEASVCGGILFDNDGTMLVARPLGLDKVTPDGTVTTFCDLSLLEKGRDYYFKSPFIWDMKYDSKNDIIAAAQDRILKISADGTVNTLVREDFDGFLGASGLEIDKEGNLYVVSGGTIYKYSADLQKTVYYESEDYHSFFSIAFSPDNKYLYLSDFRTKALVKYSVNPDGTIGQGIELIREPIKKSESFGAPLNIIFTDSGSLYVSIDGMAHLLKIDKDENQSLINMNRPEQNHIIAFGGKEFEQDCIYFTTYGNKVCKLKIDENLVK